MRMTASCSSWKSELKKFHNRLGRRKLKEFKTLALIPMPPYKYYWCQPFILLNVIWIFRMGSLQGCCVVLTQFQIYIKIDRVDGATVHHSLANILCNSSGVHLWDLQQARDHLWITKWSSITECWKLIVFFGYDLFLMHGGTSPPFLFITRTIQMAGNSVIHQWLSRMEICHY